MNEAASTSTRKGYDHAAIEAKWRTRWERRDVCTAKAGNGAPTCYVLDMFAYPSGVSMHVGHPRGYVASDVYARFKRMNGFQVLHPMGWDSFGLPAEEAAITRGEHPSRTVARNVALFKSQLCKLGLSYDWSREINTSDPAFYRHTQRLFLEFFRQGLAYNAKTMINWCPELGTVLANEDIENGVSERGGHPIELVKARQWMLRITAYADRLLHDLDRLTRWPEKIKKAQAQWIGRSVGHALSFAGPLGVAIDVFTTRIETLPGVGFVALAPGGALAARLSPVADNRNAVQAYIDASRAKTVRDRQIDSNITGVVLGGLRATNPLNGETVPIVLADYVLEDYGSGAVMGVPAHDDRDLALAEVLGLRCLEVVNEAGALVNSGDLDGEPAARARAIIAERVNAREQTRFKMRDWVFSRQRFWGEPFPIVWIAGQAAYAKCRASRPVAEWLPKEPISYVEDGVTWFAVPVIPTHLDAARLPDVDAIKSTGDMRGPLAALEDWVNVKLDPNTGAILAAAVDAPDAIPARRETNTMPQWAGSSWYWLRFMDPGNAAEPFSAGADKKWGPVSVYVGGDHAVAHLLYARFWQKALFDAGLVHSDEPFERLEFLGHVLAADGSKISKRKGNGPDPEHVLQESGADALRLYELAIGPFDKSVPWIDGNVRGYRRFLSRVFSLGEAITSDPGQQSAPQVRRLLNRCVDAVSRDIEAFHFNTAVAALMTLVKALDGLEVSGDDFRAFLRILAPFAPHLAEEIWSWFGETDSIHLGTWPHVDPGALARDVAIIPVQINGRRRAEIQLPIGTPEATARRIVLNEESVRRWLGDASVQRFVFVPDRIVNIVVSNPPSSPV